MHTDVRADIMAYEFAALAAFVLAVGLFLLSIHRTVSTSLIYAGLCLAVVAGLVEMRAQPKPLVLEWRSQEDIDVLWFQLLEGEAILILLQTPSGPRYYSMNWDEETAEQLLKAGGEVEGGAGRLKMRRLEPSLETDEEPLFHADPWPTLPLKGS